jgi:UPF0716 protein FxsA
MILSRLIAAFIIIPFVEMMILFEVHARLGLLETIALVVITGIIGATLARAQGLMVMQQIQRELAQGQMPAPRLIDGILILVAGALLITPGLLTDTVGFLLLVPAFRKVVRAWLRSKFELNLQSRGPGHIDI